MTRQNRVILNALRNARDTVEICADGDLRRMDDEYLRNLYLKLNDIIVDFRERNEDETDD